VAPTGSPRPRGEKALATAAALGAARGDVIRTRLLLSPGAAREDGVRANGEAFAGIAPANTTYVVARFHPGRARRGRARRDRARRDV